MRVITGKFKGRALVAPKGDARPTLDRMKETLFNVLAFKLAGANVLDLFAGSGQLAIESLSRGGQYALLCDDNRDSVTAIKTNFQKLGIVPNLHFGDYSACIAQANVKFDVVFVDPPYGSGVYYNVLQLLDKHDSLSVDGWVVCEHGAEVDLPQNVGSLILFDCRKMGSVKFSFYKRSSV